MSTPTISGGVINFVNSNYTPPSAGQLCIYNFSKLKESPCILTWTDDESGLWTDHDIVSWGLCSTGMTRQLYTDEDYSYLVTTTGLYVYDLVLEGKVAYLEQFGGFSTVCGNSTYLFLGTKGDGLKYMYKSCIEKDYVVPRNASTCLNTFNRFYLSSDYIEHVSANDELLVITTVSGVSVIGLTGQGFVSNTTTSGAQQATIAENNKIYYRCADSITDAWNIHALLSPLVDWEIPNYSINTTVSGLENINTVNDFFVTDDLFALATNDGVYIYDHVTKLVKKLVAPFCLNNKFNSVWLTSGSDFNFGTLQASTSDGLYIYDLATNKIKDSYTIFFKGAANEKISIDDNIIDLNVGGG